jgi:hypothetical protein
MADPNYSNFQERVVQAAEAVLQRDGSVGPLELMQQMRLLQPVHVEGWRKGNEDYRVLRAWIQVGPEKFQKTIRHARTNYDELLMCGTERLDARALIREGIDRVLAEWSGASESSTRRRNPAR